MNRMQEAAIEAKLEAERLERVRVKQINKLEGQLANVRALLCHFPGDREKLARERALIAKLRELRGEAA